uniref:Gag-Pol polyprotein n=1 Tax=Anthurium amnicola TaxID=1678845 RepID=A0A1D1YZ35_9ARAE
MGRKCSHCGKSGHNSRTCSGSRNSAAGGGLRLFGVQLQMEASGLKKSFILGCQSPCATAFASSAPPSVPSPASTSPSPSSSSLVSIEEATDKVTHGYLSDGLMAARTQQQRKKEIITHTLHVVGRSSLDRGRAQSISSWSGQAGKGGLAWHLPLLRDHEDPNSGC